MGRAREEKRRRKKIKEEKIRRKKIQVHEKVGKSRSTLVFPVTCGPGGLKNRLAKAAGAEPSGQMRDEKLHADVARSTSASKKGKDTSRSGCFWKLRCRKSARRFSLKHILKSKADGLEGLLEIEMLKKCTPSRSEAHFQVNMYEAHQVQSTWGG